MPNYCYTTKDGKTTVVEFFPMDQRPKSIKLADGRKAYRDVGADVRGWAKKSAGLYPAWSDALGVLPSEIPGATKEWARAGESVEFHPVTGDMKINGPREKQRRRKIMGLVNKDGGYAD